MIRSASPGRSSAPFRRAVTSPGFMPAATRPTASTKRPPTSRCAGRRTCGDRQRRDARHPQSAWHQRHPSAGGARTAGLWRAHAQQRYLMALRQRPSPADDDRGSGRRIAAMGGLRAERFQPAPTAHPDDQQLSAGAAGSAGRWSARKKPTPSSSSATRRTTRPTSPPSVS